MEPTDPKKSSGFFKKLDLEYIPFVENLVEKEETQLNWLIENNAPPDFIKQSRGYLMHFKFRLEEYKEFLRKHSQPKPSLAEQLKNIRKKQP